MGSCGPAPVERDSRGILDPWLLRQRVRLTRYPAGAALDGLVDMFWAVRWDLPPGQVHRQQILTRPGANVSIGHRDARAAPRRPAGRSAQAGEAGGSRADDRRDERAGRIEAQLNGVARGLTTRALAGQGWAVAALTRPGGLGAFIAGAASEFTDRIVPLGQAIGVDDAALLRHICAEPDEAARVGLLSLALERAVDPERAVTARRVAEVARLAETSRSVRRLSDLCEMARIGQRTLQRMFMTYAGVSPTWVLRRYRLLDAAEAVRGGEHVSWAAVAADLGYADQAHLIRDFRAAIGQTPAAYAAAQSPRSRSGSGRP